MKLNVKQVDYRHNETKFGNWWVWKEICDRCGAVVSDVNMLHSVKPNLKEQDYCIDCYRELLKNENK